jgi:hypothetical protein
MRSWHLSECAELDLVIRRYGALAQPLFTRKGQYIDAHQFVTLRALP